MEAYNRIKHELSSSPSNSNNNNNKNSNKKLQSPKRRFEISGKNMHEPFSRHAYRKRLSTFTSVLNEHFPVIRPFSCSSVKAAMCGFTLFDHQWGGIECVTCHARDYQPYNVDNALMQTIYNDYARIHLLSCPWRTLPCLESVQYFDCSEDLLSIYQELIDTWKDQKTNNPARFGFKHVQDGNVGECVYGCGRCYIDSLDGDLTTLHHMYCPWRWKGVDNDEPCGCELMQSFAAGLSKIDHHPRSNGA